MKKLRVLLVFLVLLFTVVGHTSSSEAEEDCYFECLQCLMSVELETPETSAAIQKCLIDEQLCLFFIGID